MTMRPSLFLLFTFFAMGVSALQADWAQVTALDLPVTKLSPDPLKARLALKDRFETQIAVNEAFLKEFPNDPHVYDSKVRLAVAKARLGSLEQNDLMVESALDQLSLLEKNAPDENQRAEASFRRISLQWQNLGKDPDQRRERAVLSAKVFAQQFPQDRRSPRLLAEAASLCDNHPEEKRQLIELALGLSKEAPLTLRLQDDLKRLNQLGNPVALQFTDTQGNAVDLAKYRGKVVALVFWAAESAPSLLWMRDFSIYASGVPDLKVVGISLDHEKSDLDAAMNTLKIDWPMDFDGKGWQSSVTRQFGINAIPTLWLIDRHGILRAINARDNYQFLINSLLRQ